MTLAEAKLTWTQRYRRDPDLAQSIVEALQLSLAEAQARADKLEEALERIRDYHGNWALNMRQIALEALK
jgi:hypothetical protein